MLKKVLLFSSIGLVSVLLIGYLAMAYVSSKRFFPNTKINGYDCSFKTPEYVEGLLHENPADYSLEIDFRGTTEKITGKDIGLKFDFKSGIDEIKNEQNPFMWFMFPWNKEHEVEKKISFEDGMIATRLDKMPELDETKMIQPENPVIQLNDEDVVEAVIKEEGNVIEDFDALHNLVADAVAKLETKIDVDEAGLYKEPEYTLDHPKVKKCLEYCNKIVGLDSKYIYGTTGVPIEKYLLYSTITIDENYNTAISKFKVFKMLESFSRLHDTYGKARKFKNHDGRYLSITDGDYGWQINIEEEAEQLYGDLIRARGIFREPVFENTGFIYEKDGNDIGTFYAEVCISKQHMYLYKDKRMVLHSDVVTGCLNQGHGTPSGIYSVKYKQSPAVLKGEDYESKVTYWMPFNGGIGFHDATWRGWFGGDIYVYSGSHGCVNMPYSAAEEMFYLIEEGIPVIVYE